ncbi:peptidase S8 [bacterium]|nr:peptidase S8 [bacterium]
MKKRKSVFIFLIAVFCLSTTSFQQVHRDQKQRKINDSRNIHMRQAKIPCLNDGLPYRADPKGSSYVSDQVLVKFKSTLSSKMVKATIASYGLEQIKRIPQLNIFQLQVPENLSVKEMISYLEQNPDVQYAEPNYKAHLAVTPNDTLFKYQYALQNSGQEIGVPGAPQGKSNADIKATQGWKETKGVKEVIIAVVDSGVDMEHPDLKDNIYSSGKDFANDDLDATDDNGHGTFVSSLAAAVTNNSEGIAGVAWNCKVLPLKVTDEKGEAFYSWVIEAIRYAVDNEAQVINVSLGGNMPSHALEDALSYADRNDVLVVAAAGNDSGPVLYPAAYDKYCVAVAATDYKDSRAEWSNYGPEIDVAAPGVRVIGCVPTWYWGEETLPYGWGFGTSASTPHVAGMAALIKSIKPWLTPSEIMKIIRYSSDDINQIDYPGKDEYLGYGRVNLEKALVPILISSSEE